MRLIDADLLIADILESRRSETETVPKLIALINNQPTEAWKGVEPTVEPNCADGCIYGWGSDECEKCKPKRGRWIIGNKTSVFDLAGVETWAVRMTCSECSFSLNFVEGHTAQYRFCPQCGARMESENE